MDKVEIYEWLKAQKYQTEYEYTGEYRMYFEVDMPKILEAYYEHKVKKLNKPAVINNEAMKCSCGKECKIPMCFECFKKGLERESEVSACQGCGRELDQMDYAVGMCYECGLII